MSNDNWTTPDWLFRYLNSRFHFALDAAATKENAKCKRFYDEQSNGLESPWDSFGWTFCNPPYSEVGEWVHKAFEEFLVYSRRSLLLVPVRSDQTWWHEIVINPEGVCDVEWYLGRISFGNSKGSAWMYNVNLVFGDGVSVVPSLNVKELKKLWAS